MNEDTATIKAADLRDQQIRSTYSAFLKAEALSLACHSSLLIAEAKSVADNQVQTPELLAANSVLISANRARAARADEWSTTLEELLLSAKEPLKLKTLDFLWGQKSLQRRFEIEHQDLDRALLDWNAEQELLCNWGSEIFALDTQYWQEIAKLPPNAYRSLESEATRLRIKSLRERTHLTEELQKKLRENVVNIVTLKIWEVRCGRRSPEELIPGQAVRFFSSAFELNRI